MYVVGRMSDQIVLYRFVVRQMCIKLEVIIKNNLFLLLLFFSFFTAVAVVIVVAAYHCCYDTADGYYRVILCN